MWRESITKTNVWAGGFAEVGVTARRSVTGEVSDDGAKKELRYSFPHEISSSEEVRDGWHSCDVWHTCVANGHTFCSLPSRPA